MDLKRLNLISSIWFSIKTNKPLDTIEKKLTQYKRYVEVRTDAKHRKKMLVDSSRGH